MQLTRILDTLYDADRKLANGRLEISTPAFTAADGTQIVGGRITFSIVNGAIDFQLAPTANSNPPATYTARYFLTNGASYAETWNVPISITPITISKARGTV